MEELGKFLHGLNDKYRVVVIDTGPYTTEDAICKALEMEDLEEI